MLQEENQHSENRGGSCSPPSSFFQGTAQGKDIYPVRFMTNRLRPFEPPVFPHIFHGQQGERCNHRESQALYP